MASLFPTIATSVKTVLDGITGLPTVGVRKWGATQPREAYPRTTVWMGNERIVRRAFEGTILKEYQIVVAIYRDGSGNISSGLATNADLITSAKQALDISSLAGVSAVYEVEILENNAWEGHFDTGVETSAFGILVRTSEARNG